MSRPDKHPLIELMDRLPYKELCEVMEKDPFLLRYEIPGGELFYELRNKAYRLPEFKDDAAACNCYTKNNILFRALQEQGHVVRERIIEFDWNTMLPDAIATLWPVQYPTTHYYIEICEDGAWRALDASFDMPLAEAAGYHWGDWYNRKASSLSSTRDYTEAERLEYMKQWNDPTMVEAYFNDVAPFMQAANNWFAEMRLS